MLAGLPRRLPIAFAIAAAFVLGSTSGQQPPAQSPTKGFTGIITVRDGLIVGVGPDGPAPPAGGYTGNISVPDGILTFHNGSLVHFQPGPTPPPSPSPQPRPFPAR